MIRTARFLISQRLFAVDLSTLDLSEPTHPQMRAVWYRRRRGVTVACIGRLWDVQNPGPADAAEFLARHDDGRYGGRCEGRWDGTGYWGAEQPAVVEEHLAVLRPMLDNLPQIPPTFDGWWRF